ncbi:MAG: deoxyguanosinetriphosphate triphosphohydrolase [Chloroflexota bacterium]|nr:MAG: deoxyguanosinetriphosphate triphosphohydrolase [Chloroflexota bacterium]
MALSDIRLHSEENEEQLAPFAARSRLSRGRERPEEPCPVRTAYQRDRDRILYSKAFRRLKHKTQVFIAPQGDHYITRLTHTLEVAQLARTIARALRLNEDLTEAISLGHDLGHTPFGHAGEEALNAVCPSGFRHQEQSLRVVDHLEKDGRGLNLTWEVREGILKHSKPRVSIMAHFAGPPSTLEAQVCRLADSIAYINHDVPDAIRAGIIAEEDLPPRAVQTLGHTPRERINTLVCDVIAYSLPSLEPGSQQPRIEMSPQVLEAANLLREFLFQRVYTSEAMRKESDEARKLIAGLYEHFLAHPEELPPELLRAGEVERAVVDHIAGMTDRYALETARERGLGATPP